MTSPFILESERVGENGSTAVMVTVVDTKSGARSEPVHIAREGCRDGAVRLAKLMPGTIVADVERELRNELDGDALIAPVLTNLATVDPRPIDWLWNRRFALGKLNLVFGDPGLGKSFLTIDMAARVTTGSPWPDGTPCPMGGVILITAEDDLADTIRPRLDRAGADVSKVEALEAIRAPGKNGGTVERSFTLADIPQLEDALRRVDDCKLLIIDPVSAYLGGKDGHRNDEIRGLLTPVSKLAGDSGVAVVMVTHLSKGAGGRALYRAMGSLAFAAAARSAWLVVRDEVSPSRRLLLPAKNNIGDDATGFAFAIQDGAVQWEKAPVMTTADQALSIVEGDGKPGPDPEALEAAKEWIAEFLKDGPVEASKVEAEAKAARISMRTLRRAKEKMGVRSFKDQFSKGWMWKLKATPTPL